MAKRSLFIWLILSSLLANAQEIEQHRWLAGNYQPQPVEQAVITLTAANVVGANAAVDYKAGQSVVLLAGFEAKAGSIFLAHTGAVSARARVSGEPSLTVNAYPNPFDQAVTITYVLTKSGRTNLQISNTEGRLISQLVDDRYQEAGRYSVEWKERGILAGTYVCVLNAGPQRVSRRIIRK